MDEKDIFETVEDRINDGMKEGEKFVLENIKEPLDFPFFMAKSRYILNACLKLMEDSGLPRSEIDFMNREADKITKERVKGLKREK